MNIPSVNYFEKFSFVFIVEEKTHNRPSCLIQTMNIVINRISGGRAPKAADGGVKTKLSSGRPYNFVDFQKY